MCSIKGCSQSHLLLSVPSHLSPPKLTFAIVCIIVGVVLVVIVIVAIVVAVVVSQVQAAVPAVPANTS